MESDHPEHLAHIFASNIPPQPLEIPSIEHAIEETSKAIDELQQRLQKLQHHRQGYRTLLSAVRRIPPEVLGEIFSFFLAIIRRRKERVTHRLRVPLIDLCLVCRAWRDAAFSTPELWTVFEISSSSVPASPLLERASQWFSRCKGIPNKTLLVYHRFHPRAHDCVQEGCNVANPNLAKLLAEGPSFENLVFECTGPQCFRALVGLMDSPKSEKIRPWDSIKSLGLGFHQDWDEVKPSNSIFHLVPSVTSLALELPDRYLFETHDEDIQLLLRLHPLQPVLTNLTTFTFLCDWDNMATLSGILRLCINTEVLTLDFKNSRRSSALLPLVQFLHHEVLLPSLRILRLRRVQDAAHFLQSFNTPLLVELDINFIGSDDEGTVRSFMPPETLPYGLASFVARSRSKESLRKLRLASIDLTGTRPIFLKDILGHFPALTHLVLDNVQFDPFIFCMFGIDKKGFLPRVQVLELLRLGRDFPLSFLSIFVSKRRPENVLKKIVTTFRDFEPQDFDGLDRSLKLDGVVHVNMVERGFTSGFT